MTVFDVLHFIYNDSNFLTYNYCITDYIIKKKDFNVINNATKKWLA